MGHHNKLSESDLARMAEMYRECRCTATVARHMGISRSAVQRRLKDMSFDLRRPSRVHDPKHQKVPVVTPEQMERVIDAGRRFVRWRKVQRARQCEEMGWRSTHVGSL